MDELDYIIAHTKKLKLLYVEDNQEARESSLLVFEEFFDDIIVAVDGKDGLEKFNMGNDINIIITDINMPHLNGLEMLMKIREINKHIPVLILSAYNESNFFIESIKLDVEGYLLKPIDLEQFLATLRKIVEKIDLKNEAKKNLHFLHQYQEATDANSIVTKTDIDGKITYANDAFCEISGYTKEEILNCTHNIIRSTDKENLFYEEFWDTIKTKKQIWQGVFRNISKNNKSYYVKSTIKPILNNNGEIIEFIALMDDISDIMNPKKQFHDLVDSFDKAIVLLMKIEDFEEIDKYYGQILATKIQEGYLSVLKQNLPKFFEDDKLFALGNGEYAVVKEMKSSSLDLTTELKKFQSNVEDEALTIEGIEYELSIMISYAQGADALENSKYGLRELEESHHDFIIATDFSKKVQEEAQKNINVLKTIKNALNSNNIVSYFQPIVNSKTLQIEKYESLVRIVDENGEVLAPYFFLDIAKKGKYYSHITSVVLENSFKALSLVNKNISINLSASDIDKRFTRNKILELLNTHRDDAHRIIFELLEDEDIKDFDKFKSFIAYVKSMGVQIAIDDFGAGYSNFERLLNYEPDILKIDGSLVKNIESDKFSLDIIETIVTFAKKQNIKLIAEYVENENIYLILKNLGIDYLQGYYFGKPEPLK